MQEKRLDLKYNKDALKFLERCENILYKRLIRKINILRTNPFPSDSKFMKGKNEKVYRVRVGDYRIFYMVFYDKSLLYITTICKRPQAYLREENEEYGEEILIKKCCCCGKDILVKVFSDGRYEGGNYFPGEDGENDLSWECDWCWNN